MLNGRCLEGGKTEVELPDDDPEQISIFVRWTYIGSIKSCVEVYDVVEEEEVFIGAYLWVLGDKLLSPKFTNVAMTLTVRYFVAVKLNTGTTEFVYDNTCPNFKLRVFIRDSIAFDGPLSASNTTVYNRKAWVSLLKKGGDLLEECMGAGFHNRCVNRLGIVTPFEEVVWSGRNLTPTLVPPSTSIYIKRKSVSVTQATL